MTELDRLQELSEAALMTRRGISVPWNGQRSAT